MEIKEILVLFLVLSAAKEALCMSWFLFKLSLKALVWIGIVWRIALVAMRLGI